MESYASRGIILGVSVLITVAIASAIFIVLGYVLDIYKNVAKIDYASLMKFNELDKYSVSEYKNGMFQDEIVVDGKTVENPTLTGIELYNLLNKVISQNNMKTIDDDNKFTLNDCLDTYKNAKEVRLNTNTYNLKIKNLTSTNINFIDSNGNYIEETFSSKFYCVIEKEAENNDAVLYFKKK